MLDWRYKYKKEDSMQHSFVALAGLSAAILTGGAQAQTFPVKPITVIVAFAAGGPVDLETRMYTTKAGELLGQPMVTDYKVGGGTTIGTGYVAKARPDGYTLLSGSASLTVFPAFYKDLNFDIIKDLAPITQMSQRSSLLVASPNAPFKTFAEYIAYARANPGKINYGTSGVGDITHLLGEWLHSLSKTRVTFVPFKGTGPLMVDLMASRLDVTSATLIASLPLVKSGKLKALAALGKERSKHMPDIPTVAEGGLHDFQYANWLGIFAPGGTPPAVVNRLNEVLVTVLKQPAIVAELDAQGSLAIGNTPEQFHQYVAAEARRWQSVVDVAGIKLTQ